MMVEGKRGLEDLFGDDEPTKYQALWGRLFMELYERVSEHGRGAGKSWFWKRVWLFLGREEGLIEGREG